MRFSPIVAFVLLLASVVLVAGSAYQDIRYLVSSKLVDADLLSAKRGSDDVPNDKSIYVEYTFKDGGLERLETDRLSAAWEVPAGPKVSVAYIPGEAGASHVAGNWDGYWLLMLGMLGLVAFIIAASIAYGNYQRKQRAASRAERRNAAEKTS